MAESARFEAFKAYCVTRWHALIWRDWKSVNAYRNRRLARFLKFDLPKVPAYRHLKGGPLSLSTLPVTDKPTLMSAFDAYNQAGIAAEAGWAAFSGSKRLGELTVGASTGTSGNRGLFVISNHERFRWLGVMLAKALPDFWYRRQRVAVILPINTPLYDAANASSLLTLRFFDVTSGPESWVDDLQAFAPTVIVSSPRILVWIARHAPLLNPRKLFSAAETLDPHERLVIEQRFGGTLGQIYMATEGLIAVSCREGTLHLCDDTMFIELEPAAGGLVTPLITDFSRQMQVMVRYRMNDLLRMAEKPCRCGSPLRAVAELIGRQDDAFRFRVAETGKVIEFTPDVLRNAIVDADRRIDDYRLIQTGAATVELMLPEGLAKDAGLQAHNALNALFAGRGAQVSISLQHRTLHLETGRKLRRVANATSRPEQGP